MVKNNIVKNLKTTFNNVFNKIATLVLLTIFPGVNFHCQYQSYAQCEFEDVNLVQEQSFGELTKSPDTFKSQAVPCDLMIALDSDGDFSLPEMSIKLDWKNFFLLFSNIF